MNRHLAGAEARFRIRGGITGAGFGDTIYRTDDTLGTMTDGEAAFLGHEALHGVHAMAHGGIAAFDRSYGESLAADGYFRVEYERAACSFGPQRRGYPGFDSSFAQEQGASGPVLLDPANDGWWP